MASVAAVQTPWSVVVSGPEQRARIVYWRSLMRWWRIPMQPNRDGQPKGLCPECHKLVEVWWGKLGRHQTKDDRGNPYNCLGSGETPLTIDLP